MSFYILGVYFTIEKTTGGARQKYFAFFINKVKFTLDNGR